MHDTSQSMELNTRQSTGSTGIREAHTRFLYPFSFERRSVVPFVELITEQKFEGAVIWEPFDATNIANEYYRSEIQNAALTSLFGTGRSPRYLRMNPATGNLLFPHRLTMRHEGIELPFRFSSRCPAEIFISPFGVGVLCLMTELDVDRLASAQFGGGPCRPDHLVIFNYRMSKLREWGAPSIRVNHPRDYQPTWDSIPESKRKSIPDPPSPSAPFKERVRGSGGEYRLPELNDFLLRFPLDALRVDPYQTQFSVYTVLRFDNRTDFSDSATSLEMGRLLSALSQVEEHTHAGSPAGQPGVVHDLLNANHWAGVGCLGAAHLVSDQSADVAFNEERAQRARDRYFIAYVAAYMQKLAIRRAGDRIGEAIAGLQEDSDAQPIPDSFEACAPAFRQILKDMIEFNAVEYLPEISYREVINRYYRKVQEGLQVPEAWARTQRGIADLDAACRTASEELLLTRQTDDIGVSRETLRESKDLQAKVEWVEILIIGIYIAELIHTLGDSFHFRHEFTGVALLIYSGVAMLAAYKILNPGEHVKLPHLRKAIPAALAALGLFIWLGSLFFHEAPSHPEQPPNGGTDARAPQQQPGH